MRPIWFAVTAEPAHAARAAIATLEAARGAALRVEAHVDDAAPAEVLGAWSALRDAWTGPVGKVFGKARAAMGGGGHGTVRFPAADDGAWAGLLALVPWVTVDLVGDGQVEVARVAGGGVCVARLTPDEGEALRESLAAADGDGEPVATVERLSSNRVWFDFGSD